VSKKPQIDWAGIEVEYRAAVRSLRAISDLHGVPEATIRLRAKKHGWVRDASGLKREIVKDAMSGVVSKPAQKAAQETAQETVRRIESAADEDIADMERGIRISRSCLEKLETAVTTAKEPKEIKVIVEATGMAIDSIRRIRGLDSPPGSQPPKDDEMTHEELIEECKRLGLPTSIFG
jgi:hypothetical protein